MTVLNYYNDHIPVFWGILMIYKINIDLIPQLPALFIVCIERLMTVFVCSGGTNTGYPGAAHCEKVRVL